jgi:hypothetical protein
MIKKKNITFKKYKTTLKLLLEPACGIKFRRANYMKINSEPK